MHDLSGKTGVLIERNADGEPCGLLAVALLAVDPKVGVAKVRPVRDATQDLFVAWEDISDVA